MNDVKQKARELVTDYAAYRTQYVGDAMPLRRLEDDIIAALTKPMTWEQICDLITISAKAASKLGHSLDDNEEYPDALALEDEFITNIRDYCENEHKNLSMMILSKI